MLKTALANIHRDRGWWHKMLVGGALYLSLLGLPLADGFELESIDNIRRGFPTPLPRWAEWGNKAVMGAFGLVIDVFFFVFPMLVGGMVLLCAVLSSGAFGNAAIGRSVAIVIVGFVLGYIGLVWLSGAGISSKYYFVVEGDVAKAMQVSLVRQGLRTSGRSPYMTARLLSLPFYLLAVVLLLAAGWLINRNGWTAVLVGWLGCSSLFYARVVTIHLYSVAMAEYERRQFSL